MSVDFLVYFPHIIDSDTYIYIFHSWLYDLYFSKPLRLFAVKISIVSNLLILQTFEARTAIYIIWTLACNFAFLLYCSFMVLVSGYVSFIKMNVECISMLVCVLNFGLKLSL